MVRKPRMVWPGLDKEGLHLKHITGDGNCLFASLSDQLYGTPSRHGEIRTAIIDHMRTFRPLYEDFVHTNDVIQKRATRATTEFNRKNMEDDAFEGYLIAMARLGTYGGQPELLAFVRTYDQDVTVHLPPSMGWNNISTLPYKNQEREEGAEVKPALHICYGGDEDSRAHYDSSQKSDNETHDRMLTARPKLRNQQNDHAVQHNHELTSRAVRNLKSDPSKDMMHELVTRGSKDLRGSFNDSRARSPSTTSSHYSTSSKRSHEDDADQYRASKRMDRKRRSLRSRAAVKHLNGSPSLTIPRTTSQPTSSGPPTPTSSQDTDSSSDQAEPTRKPTFESGSPSLREVINLIDDDSDYQETTVQPQRHKTPTRQQAPRTLDRDIINTTPSIITEQSRSVLHT